ncbi:MAG: hypothetical protein R8J85_09765 [Mariprofundales bacterium]
MMQPLPPKLIYAYDVILAQRGINGASLGHFKKWLRFYLDYCHKYHAPPRSRQSFSKFHDKLRLKHQSEEWCKQAYHAVSLYYELVDGVKKEPSRFYVDGKVTTAHPLVTVTVY